MIREYSSPVQYMLSLDKTVGLIFNTKTFFLKKKKWNVHMEKEKCQVMKQDWGMSLKSCWVLYP